MSIDERLRTGLVANTDHLVPDVERALETTLDRRRARRWRRTGLAVAAAAAAVGIAWWVAVPRLGSDTAPVTPTPEPGPRDLVGVEGPLPPGSYSIALWGSQERGGDQLPRAVLEVPAGYFSNGGYVVDAGLTGASDDQYGDVAVWRATRVPADPCQGRVASRVGPTVEDLARALVRQRGPSTRPRPVVVDGHRGLELAITVPSVDLGQCPGGEYTLWRTEPDDDAGYARGTVGVVVRVWILDVDGTRLTVAAALYPDESEALHRELVAMARGIRFVPAP